MGKATPEVKEEQLNLIPVQRHYLGIMYEWRNSPDIMHRTRQFRQLTWEEHERWFDNLDPNENLMYAIIRGNALLLGVVGLTHLDWVNRSAEVSIYIKENHHKRKGYGRWAIAQLMHICFDQLNFHKLWAEVYDLPESTIPQFFEKCGFLKDGEIRDTVFRNGKYYSSIFYSITEGEWRAFS